MDTDDGDCRDVVECQNEREWMSANEAMATLKPYLSQEQIAQSIATRAHNGLIRARAKRFEWETQGHNNPSVGYPKVKNTNDNYLVPKEFWWAGGHEALEQNWALGDFSTWIDHIFHWQAFGVEFDRGAIEEMVPVTERTLDSHADALPAVNVPHVREAVPSDEAIRDKMLELIQVYGLSRDNAAKIIGKQIKGFEGVQNEHARRLVKGELPIGRPPRK